MSQSATLDTRTELLDAALRYAARGWQVIPLFGVDERGRCACGNGNCASPGKHPHIREWQTQATCDAGQVMRWWDRWPDANVGILTGEQSGLMVLDVDGEAGEESLREQNLHLPPTLIAATGRPHGSHHYYRHPGGHQSCLIGRLGPKLDVKADGGYVVAPPSRHARGRLYRWEVSPDIVEPAPAPPWLLRQADEDEPSREPLPALPDVILQSDPSRDQTLFRYGCLLRRAGFSQAEIEAALLVVNRDRCRPPLSEQQVRAKAASAARYQPQDPILPAEAEAAPERHLEIVSAADLLQFTPERPEWLAAGIAARSCITDLVAAPKAGKTTFMLALVRALLSASPFLGEPTTRTGVLYLTEERAPSFRAALERTGIAAEGLHILLRQAGMGWSWAEVMAQATQAALRADAGLMVIDSFADWASLAGDAENNAGAILEALRPVQQAAEQGLAVLLVRHDSKGPAREVGEAGRGSNAAAGACDILLALRKLGGADSHTRRRLDYAGRFDSIPDARIIEWRADTHTYLSLGTQAEVELSDWKRRLLDVLAAEPVKEADLVEALGTEEHKAPRSTVRHALADLVAEGQVIRSGSGRKGSPYLYSAVERPC